MLTLKLKRWGGNSYGAGSCFFRRWLLASRDTPFAPGRRALAAACYWRHGANGSGTGPSMAGRESAFASSSVTAPASAPIRLSFE